MIRSVYETVTRTIKTKRSTTNRHRLLLALILLLLGAGGCKKSADSSLAVSSPTPGVQAPSMSLLPRTEKPAALAAGLPIQVRPPASFAGDQLPQDDPVLFAVQGNAGQFLRVKVNEAKDAHTDFRGPRFSVEVRTPGARPELLEVGSEDCYPGNWLYALPQTGTYQVSFDRAKGRHAIAFTLLDQNDPTVSPGITLEQISIDISSLAQGSQFSVVPANKACDESEPWPSHLALKNRRFEFRVMTVAGYKEILRPDEMKLLQTAVMSGGKDLSFNKLPYPFYGGGGLLLATKPELLQGQGWRGLRWIGAFGQDVSCEFRFDGENSAYVFEGISNDSKYFILVRAAISNSPLADRLRQDCDASLHQNPKRSIDALFEKDMPALFEKDIAGADPASFQPNLDQLDAVVRSLKLKK